MMIRHTLSNALSRNRYRFTHLRPSYEFFMGALEFANKMLLSLGGATLALALDDWLRNGVGEAAALVDLNV